MEMPFGKYKGMDLRDVPLTYLMWLEENCELRVALREAVNFEIDRRNGDTPGMGKVIKK